MKGTYEKIYRFSLLALSSTSFAGNCKLNFKRLACPGQEEAAYKPYDNKHDTEENHEVKDAAECKKMGIKQSKIVRKSIFSSKAVTYSYEGGAAATSFDKSDCK